MIPPVEKHSQERTAKPQISPLRFATVEMTKGRAVLPGRVAAEREPFFITLGGPKAHGTLVEMTKGRVAEDREVCYWNGAA
jgi:hypothetical protein